MCGISGSRFYDKGFELYQANLKRGYFSSGFLAYDDQDNIFVAKQKEPFEYESLRKDMIKCIGDPTFCLFHSRAPTNSKAPYSDDTTHPFNFANFYVAHNGIISNFISFPESAEFDVDSSIIPFHLHKHDGDIKHVYEEYEGLLSSWIFDYNDFSLKVVKAGSSLHIDDTSFSSVSFKGSEPVDDGVVYKLVNNKLKPAHEYFFKYDNPYDL